MIQTDILQKFANKNVVITGFTGMIGRQVALLLKSAGANIRGLSLDDVHIGDGIEHVKGDLTDFDFCMQQLQGADYVFHIAGIKGSVEVTKSKPASFFVPLLRFNTNVLEAARLNKVEKLVYTSSIGAYSSAEVFKENDEEETNAPMDMFPGWAKRMAELQIKAYSMQYGLNTYSIVRPCNVYGPGDNFDPENAMVIPTLLSRIANGEKPVKVWGDGSAIRDFAFARDVAEGTILALWYGTRSTYVNLGSGVGISIRELLEAINSFLDFEYEFDASKPSGFPRRVMDITRARDWIEYNPDTPLIEGLRETWNWFQSNPDEFKRKQNYFK